MARPYDLPMAYAPVPVIVPHPVIVPSGGAGGDWDIPDSWAIGYGIVGLVVWAIAAVLFTIHETYGPVDGETVAFGVMLGACAAVVWPFTLAAGLLWLGVRAVFARAD